MLLMLPMLPMQTHMRDASFTRGDPAFAPLLSGKCHLGCDLLKLRTPARLFSSGVLYP